MDDTSEEQNRHRGRQCLTKVFKEHKPEKLWVDKGKEFYNKHVQQLAHLYSTENEEKSSVVERWNRTMKEKMFRMGKASVVASRRASFNWRKARLASSVHLNGVLFFFVSRVNGSAMLAKLRTQVQRMLERRASSAV